MFKYLLLIFVVANLSFVPSSWGTEKPAKPFANFCSKIIAAVSSRINKKSNVSQIELKTQEDREAAIKQMQAEMNKYIISPKENKGQQEYRSLKKNDVHAVENSALMLELNKIEINKVNKEQIIKNTEAIEEIRTIIRKNKWNKSELAYFSDKLTKKLVGKYFLRKKESIAGEPVWFTSNRRVADELSIVKLYAKINSLLNGSSHLTVNKKVALKTLYLGSAYNFSKYIYTMPSLGQSFLKVFNSYTPTKNSSVSDVIMIYEAVSNANIKVPNIWQKISMDWLENHYLKMPLKSAVTLYSQMLGSRVPPSHKVESFIYKSLLDNKMNLDRGQIIVLVNLMAKSLMTSSVNKEINEVKPHFDSLHKTLMELGIKIDESRDVHLFYNNAVRRLDLFEGEVVLNNFIPTNTKPIKPPTSLELKLAAALKRVLPDSNFQREKVIREGLPPVDLVDFLGKIIFEADGPIHDVLSFPIKMNGKLGLKIILRRDYDIVTHEIHLNIHYRHFRINHKEFDRPQAEFDKYLLKLLNSK